MRARALISSRPDFDAMTSKFLPLAMVGDGAELKPAMAMATSPIAKIDPTTAFPMSQRLY